MIIERVKMLKNVRIYEEFKVIEFTGNETLAGIIIRKMAGEETVTLPVRGVFIAIGLQPNSALVSHLVDLNEQGEIFVNSDCGASLPGIYAAGDVTNAFGRRIIIAAGEGAKAALAARQYLLDRRKESAGKNVAHGEPATPQVSRAGSSG